MSKTDPEFDQERSNIDRRDNCSTHIDQVKKINKIANSVGRQDGQWRILMWGVTLLAGAILYIGSIMHNSIKTTQAIVIQMDKTFSGYMTMHTEESKNGFIMINNNRKSIKSNDTMLHDHEKRIYLLEQYHDNK